MLAMLNEFVVQLSDLKFATITCSTCKTKITIDLCYAKWGDDPLSVNPACPARCPICSSNFDTTLVGSMNLFRDAYKMASKQETATVEFRVKQNAIPSKQ